MSHNRGQPLCHGCGHYHPHGACPNRRGQAPALDAPKPTLQAGRTLEPVPDTGATLTQSNEPPDVTPPGTLERGMTAASAMVRRFMGPQADEATYTLRFHRHAGTAFFLVTALYAFGHGLYGWFPCPNEVLVVQPFEGKSRKDLLKQDGGEE